MNAKTHDEAKIDNWSAIRKKIQSHYPEITKSDLEDVNGDSRRLVAIIHQKTDDNLSDIEHQIDQIAADSDGLLTRIEGHISQLAQATKDSLVNCTAQTGETIGRCLNDTQHLVKDAYAEARDKVHIGTDYAKQSVEDHPLSSMLIAFGFGALAGYGLLTSMLSEPEPETNPFWSKHFG